jgi:hypothetical protein
MNIMNDATIGLDQIEVLPAHEVSDEALEAAAGSEKVGYTLSFCSGLSVCPGWPDHRTGPDFVILPLTTGRVDEVAREAPLMEAPRLLFSNALSWRIWLWDTLPWCFVFFYFTGRPSRSRMAAINRTQRIAIVRIFFDAIYCSHFKCDLLRIADCQNLSMLEMPGKKAKVESEENISSLAARYMRRL